MTERRAPVTILNVARPAGVAPSTDSLDKDHVRP